MTSGHTLSEIMNNIYHYSIDRAEITIDVCRSAPNQLREIPKIQDLCKHWELKGYEDVIDVGCGYLRNSFTLIKYFNLYLCDYPQITESSLFKERYHDLSQENIIKKIIQPNDLKMGDLKADAAFLSFVIHTIPEKHDRIELINNIKKNLKPPHEIFIAVPCGERYYSGQRSNKTRQLNDGFFCGNGKSTFYRDYRANQLDQFMFELGFIVDKKFYVAHKRMRSYRFIGVQGSSVED